MYTIITHGVNTKKLDEIYTIIFKFVQRVAQIFSY